jgi:hypothetical protein
MAPFKGYYAGWRTPTRGYRAHRSGHCATVLLRRPASSRARHALSRVSRRRRRSRAGNHDARRAEARLLLGERAFRGLARQSRTSGAESRGVRRRGHVARAAAGSRSRARARPDSRVPRASALPSLSGGTTTRGAPRSRVFRSCSPPGLRSRARGASRSRVPARQRGAVVDLGPGGGRLAEEKYPTKPVTPGYPRTLHHPGPSSMAMLEVVADRGLQTPRHSGRPKRRGE